MQGTSGTSKLAVPRRRALAPPTVGRTFGARKQVGEAGTNSGQRGLGAGWTDPG